MVKQQNKEETLNYKQLYEEALLDIDKKQKEIDNLNNTVKSYRFQIYGMNAYEIFGYENKSSKKFALEYLEKDLQTEEICKLAFQQYRWTLKYVRKDLLPLFY